MDSVALSTQKICEYIVYHESLWNSHVSYFVANLTLLDYGIKYFVKYICPISVLRHLLQTHVDFTLYSFHLMLLAIHFRFIMKLFGFWLIRQMSRYNLYSCQKHRRKFPSLTRSCRRIIEYSPSNTSTFTLQLIFHSSVLILHERKKLLLLA